MSTENYGKVVRPSGYIANHNNITLTDCRVKFKALYIDFALDERRKNYIKGRAYAVNR